MGVAVAVAVAVSVGVDVAVLVAVAVAVAVTVGERDGVNVAVGGWELWRVIRGVIQSAKSSCEEPFARTVKINLTFCPLKKERSILMG